MFLAWREIKKEKIRYGLVITVVMLISYLVFVLCALAMGLARENTVAIESWQIKSAVMTRDANGNAGQSLLTEQEARSLQQKRGAAILGITPTTMKRAGHRESVQFIGLHANEFVKDRLQVVSGRLPQHADEIAVDTTLNHARYPRHETVTLGLSATRYKIVGYVAQAQYNMAPVVYGDLEAWSSIKGVSNDYAGSLAVYREDAPNVPRELVTYSTKQLIDKLPGYVAQKATFGLMIGFLVIISMIIMTIFLYILTIQKLPNLAVLRAQGIPNRFLTRNTLFETGVIVMSAVVIGGGLAVMTLTLLPDTVPVYISWPVTGLIALGLLLTGLLGTIVPIRLISKIDPASVIGG